VSVQLVSKISNLCGPDPPTSQTDRETDRQTDGQTDHMQSQYRALHYSASRGNSAKRGNYISGVQQYVKTHTYLTRHPGPLDL